MFADDADRTTRILKHLGNEQSKASIAQNRHPLARIHLDLLEHLKRRGEWLDENACIIIDISWEHMQIHRREPHKVCKGTVVIENSEHGSIAAMVAQARQAQVASPAEDIDLAAHALPDQVLVG